MVMGSWTGQWGYVNQWVYKRYIIEIECSSGNGDAEYYEPVVLAANDYYPFGLDMVGRTYSSGAYRFGFNGKEKDQSGEFGSQVAYDYGARVYSPGVGRFLSVDPLADLAPDWTPYRYGFNNPILYTDPFGLFETKKEAKTYAKGHRIRTGWFRSNKIV